MTDEEVYISKYALTGGIERQKVRVVEDGRAMSVQGYWQSYKPGEWHRTIPEAIAAAEALRAKKIASLRKQIDRVQKLTFAESQP